MRRIIGGSAAALLIALNASAGAAQIPYHVFDERTEVQKIRFDFVGTETFTTKRLQEEMALRGRGRFEGLRRTLSRILPFIAAPEPHPFSPVELQRDVARLRRFYSISGFRDARVSYDVTYINDRNRVDIVMHIDEGRPLILDEVTVRLPDGGNPADSVPAELRAAWDEFAARRDTAIGKRYTAAEGARISGDVLSWWMLRGWPFAKTNTDTLVDTTTARIDMAIALSPGPRARVDSIQVEGNRSVSRGLVLRTIPMSHGDWFSSSKLAEGQRRLFGLSLFRLALADVPDSQPHDSTVNVRVRLQESPPRLVTGEGGYVSAGGGLTARAEFAHRNFTGGARTLRLGGVAQTGLLASGRPDREYEVTLSFREPLLFHRRLSGSTAPFFRYRDNAVDRSNELGIENTLIYDANRFRFITLRHRYSSRRVLDYRLGSGNSVDLETLLRLAAEGALDDVDDRIERNTIGLSASLGRFDHTNARRTLQWLPSIEVTIPPTLNTIEFARAELPVSGYLPLGRRIGLAARARIGRVFPFGKTTVADSIGPLQAIHLRDVLLSTGGTGSVRGWENGLLGPKLLNLQFETLAGGDSIRVTGTDGYIPAGGLSRAAASLELRLPFPGLGPTWGTHMFLDAGRVWTSDVRFMQDDPNDEQRWFFGTGAGFDLQTLIGPVRLSIGYKLNPSPLDVRSAGSVLNALRDGRPLSSVPANWKRRLHLHVSLGQIF